MTYLTVPITAGSPAEAIEQIQQARRLGAEMLELRLDSQPVLSPLIVQKLVAAAKQTGLPVIATCRTVQQGGKFDGSAEAIVDLLATALAAGADYLDVESAGLDSGHSGFKGLFDPARKKVILSHHEFAGPIETLSEIIETIDSHQPAVTKIAFTAGHINDSFAALDELYAREPSQPPLIALAMGPGGEITRFLAKKLGGFLTFASLSPQAASAPGQYTLEQFKNVYRWDHVNSDTGLFGVIGSPIAHSLSPDIHNAAFDEIRFNGLYLPLLVEGGGPEFDRFLCNVLTRPWLDFRGLSVTIPHKENALHFIEKTGGEVENLAKKIGAVNTIIIDDDDTLHGFNTDYAAALDAVTQNLNIDRKGLKNLPAAVIGAGGVARSIVAGLRDCGAKVTLYNRTVEKAARLAEEFGCRYAPLDDEIRLADAKLIVNCTSVGMHPNVSLSPLPPDAVKKDMAVFDTVYNPCRTLLLQHAHQAGAVTIDGVTMFVNQAVRQFELFTGQKAPTALMNRIVRNRLENKTKS